MDPSFTWAHRTFLDSGEVFADGLTKPLRPGVDCPDHAQFLDGLVADDSGRPQSRANIICIFERDAGDMAWRHHAQSTDGRRKRDLVVRSAAVLGNYDYVFDWVFQQDGSIKVSVGATGVAVKDNIDTAGILTTAASGVFRDRTPEADAEVVTRLKDAGAILLGKLNLHELALGGTSSVSYFGPVRNPWNLERHPGGSSGGSGAAIAADLCFGALGTDTGGSVRIPASCCGIVGLKPTYGRVSNRGVISMAWTLDHVGPMCKTVEDAALMLRVLAGYDERDPVSVDTPDEPWITSSPELYQPATRALIQGAGNASSAVYARARRHVDEVRRDVARVFARMDLLITPTQRTPPGPIASQPTANAGRGSGGREGRAGGDGRGGRGRGGAPGGGGLNNTAAFDIYGLPTISVPCGFTADGLPIGLQISGAHFAEATVIALAHAYERATGWHTRRPDLSAIESTPL